MTSPPKFARNAHTAVLLPTGQVLVAGGQSGGDAQASAELYDPRTDRWTTGADLPTPRTDVHAGLAPDGSPALFLGVVSNRLFGVLRFAPATKSWTEGPAPSEPRYSAAVVPFAVLLADGRVLVGGGTNGTCRYGETARDLSDAWLLDPSH